MLLDLLLRVARVGSLILPPGGVREMGGASFVFGAKERVRGRIMEDSLAVVEGRLVAEKSDEELCFTVVDNNLRLLEIVLLLLSNC